MQAFRGDCLLLLPERRLWPTGSGRWVPGLWSENTCAVAAPCSREAGSLLSSDWYQPRPHIVINPCGSFHQVGPSSKPLPPNRVQVTMHFLGDGMHQNVLLIPSALPNIIAHSVPPSALLAQDAEGSQITVHGALTHTLSWWTHCNSGVQESASAAGVGWCPGS